MESKGMNCSSFRTSKVYDGSVQLSSHNHLRPPCVSIGRTTMYKRSSEDLSFNQPRNRIELVGKGRSWGSNMPVSELIQQVKDLNKLLMEMKIQNLSLPEGITRLGLKIDSNHEAVVNLVKSKIFGEEGQGEGMISSRKHRKDDGLCFAGAESIQILGIYPDKFTSGKNSKRRDGECVKVAGCIEIAIANNDGVREGEAKGNKFMKLEFVVNSLNRMKKAPKIDLVLGRQCRGEFYRNFVSFKTIQPTQSTIGVVKQIITLQQY
ncbi:hypothetical protein ACH5RR_023632 [Cinchona calisaya]|uniref:Uncharacterized protein n=1 Tax=Cinchona calisaya TaxID=153742 RepID=A0ABD2ZEJ2_9GENT